MLLITVTRIPQGYRLLAASSYRVNYNCWMLYRNKQLLAVISRSYQGEPCVAFDLCEPLAPGEYQLRVDCFAWPQGGTFSAASPVVAPRAAPAEVSADFTYYTSSQTVLMIAPAFGIRRPFRRMATSHAATLERC